MDRNQAWEMVCEFVKSESLRKHMLAVEACVAAYARQAGEGLALGNGIAFMGQDLGDRVDQIADAFALRETAHEQHRTRCLRAWERRE